MQILAVDVGTGTQDILLYDARIDLENCFKMVLPSPTMMVANQIKKATQLEKSILLSGVIMGGGPCQWAAEKHAQLGLSICATETAARTFNDDLTVVRSMGIEVISEDEIPHFTQKLGYTKIELKDFDFRAISFVFSQFGIELDQLQAVAVAVFDHGNAPPDISDRQFRFDYLDERIRAENRLSGFAYHAGDIPKIMTRLQAVADSASGLPVPLIVMDTAPAAVLGAMYDLAGSVEIPQIIANIGNFHTLAFRMDAAGIQGVFEHHTGLINQAKLEQLLNALASGSLQHEQVFNDHGHGALVYEEKAIPLNAQTHNLTITGPRRKMMADSTLRPHFAAPFGDMMISGCFGLLSASADLLPEFSEQIYASLAGKGGSGTPPWEVAGI